MEAGKSSPVWASPSWPVLPPPVEKHIKMRATNHNPTTTVESNHCDASTCVSPRLADFEPFVDADVVADFLSVKRRRALEWARSGEIPAHPLGSGQRRIWRFRLSEIVAALDKKVSAGPGSTPSRILTGGFPAVPKRREL
jgi:Helix-turn-helix domain